MIHSRVITLDASGTSAVGSASTPPGRYAGCYYQFADPNGSPNDDQTAHIDISALGQTLFTKNGAANADGLQNYDQTKEGPLVNGVLVANVNTITGADAGDLLKIVVYLDFGGAG